MEGGGPGGGGGGVWGIRIRSKQSFNGNELQRCHFIGGGGASTIDVSLTFTLVPHPLRFPLIAQLTTGNAGL